MSPDNSLSNSTNQSASESPKQPTVVPLLHVKSPEQFKKIFIESVEAHHEWHVRTGRIHGDISLNTLLINTRDPSNETGVLIDWENPVDMKDVLHLFDSYMGMSEELFMHYMSFEDAPLGSVTRNFVQKIRMSKASRHPSISQKLS